MMKYIVSWCIVTMYIISCPPTVTKDEFGRERYVFNDALCYKTEADCSHYSEFWSRDSAVSFMNRAKRYICDGEAYPQYNLYAYYNPPYEGCLDSIKMDSVKYFTLNNRDTILILQP